jgi:hypothetical protein
MSIHVCDHSKCYAAIRDLGDYWRMWVLVYFVAGMLIGSVVGLATLGLISMKYHLVPRSQASTTEAQEPK